MRINMRESNLRTLNLELNSLFHLKDALKGFFFCQKIICLSFNQENLVYCYRKLAPFLRSLQDKIYHKSENE